MKEVRFTQYDVMLWSACKGTTEIAMGEPDLCSARTQAIECYLLSSLYWLYDEQDKIAELVGDIYVAMDVIRYERS